MLLLALAAGAAPVQAMTQPAPGITVSLRRDFGYGGLNGDIEGLFTIRARGPEDLARVVFLIDGQTMVEVSQAPFEYQFHTSNYAVGVHTFSAIGTTSQGARLDSNTLRANFVTPGEGWQAGMRFLVPILVLTFGIILISFLAPWLMERGKPKKVLPPGAPRSYGILGGTICPKCSRPFGMHVWALNISFVGKFDRCPHCGRWSFVTRATPAMLTAAEAAELNDARKASAQPASEEDLARELDASRYSDG
jgi:hypothetical protein